MYQHAFHILFDSCEFQGIIHDVGMTSSLFMNKERHFILYRYLIANRLLQSVCLTYTRSILNHHNKTNSIYFLRLDNSSSFKPLYACCPKLLSCRCLFQFFQAMRAIEHGEVGSALEM